MNEMDFTILCKKLVRDYINSHIDKSGNILNYDVYIVWMCKTLQNNKALLSSSLSDGMYYEITFSGDKNEIYLDAYMKFENRVIDRDMENIKEK